MAARSSASCGRLPPAPGRVSPGSACAVPLLDGGAAPTPLARAVAAADVGGAVSSRREVDASFVNADIAVHLGRAPEGEWIRVGSTSRWEASGIGTVTAELADAGGRFGTSGQSLVLERRPG